ncbi:HEAT repeat domain-containing protein [Paraliomyxa miuraensis]|uniref:HEAT repeat domain-containing protein n=1 Tax=Paraliomyxa miuraensis TaxID=376150 RepID=UPI0022528644|nr:HEAT repeat domain-containing protein [Paraliomyxa miuraensis]MCX4243903.1 HEAT repeat domain-containing protein [Paraliomyxa miuraensis]
MTRKLCSHVERVRAVSGSLSGRLFAYAGFRDAEAVDSSFVHVMSAGKLTEQASIELDSAVTALCFLADDLLIAGGTNGSLYGIEVSGETATLRFSAPTLPSSTLRAPITALARDDAGQRLVAVTEDGHVAAFELVVESATPSLAPRGSRKISARPLRAVTIEPGGRRVVAAGDDGTLRALPLSAELATAELRDMPGAEGGVFALVATDDGRVAAGAGDGSIRLYYLDGAVDEENRSGDAGHMGPVRGIALGARLHDDNGQELPRRLFSISEDGQLKSWQLDSKRKPKAVEVGKAGLWALTWLPASSRAKADKRGGLLVVADKRRRVSVLTLDLQSDMGDEIDRLDSRFAGLREELGARAPKAREAALEALEGLPEDDARRMLDQALAKDDKPEVRTLAAKIIGRSGRRRSRPALRVALDDGHKDVRHAALAALTTLEADAPLAPARAALGSRHVDMRIEALSRLPRLRDVSPMVPAMIADRLRDGDAKVRHAALDALEALEPAGSLEPVRVALGRGPADIRATALLRLGRRGHGRDGEGYALLEEALDDEDAEVRRVAFLVAVAGRPALSTALRSVDAQTHAAMGKLEEGGPLAPAAAASAAGLDENTRAPLFAALVCRSADTALRGARGLGMLGDPRATGALLQLSREADASVRREVVSALVATATVMAGDERLRTRLRWLLDDPDDSVRAAAYDALRTLAEPDGEPGAVALAATALGGGHADVRSRALQLLVKLKPGSGGDKIREQADVLLGHALDDEDQGVRGEAFRTLWAWHEKSPQTVLRRASQSRHADIRERVVGELDRQRDAWADELLRELVSDAVAAVGLAAYQALVDSKNDKDRKKKFEGDDEIHRLALGSPRPAVRAAGCGGAKKGSAQALRVRLVELLDDEASEVHLAAIEALDHLVPKDQQSFAVAFGSKFWGLRVRAAELCGKRRDDRAIGPMRALLALPAGDINRPPDALRQRAARAMADVGDAEAIADYVTLLDDADPIVREMGARGLAGAVVPGKERPLVNALSHPDLPVRSWVAEGLARMGDARAVPVLAGTLKHPHRPIRLGAILSFVALGPDGIRGILQGLEDGDREIQDLVFAVVVARDLALARAGLPPDLLLAAIASSRPEIRLAAAHALEAREATEAMGPLAQELVGPPKPERAADMKKWPAEAERGPLLNVLVSVLASDDPAQRYAAARVLSLRPQPEGFWRELQRLRAPTIAAKPDAPATNWEDERPQPRKRGWIRRLLEQVRDEQTGTLTERVLEILRFVGGPRPQAAPPAHDAPVDRAAIDSLVFGTYVGLVRQAPTRGESDETHRVRRDALARLGALALRPEVGRAAVLPVLRRALSDPHHLVRKAALTTLQGLYDTGDTTPLGLALQSQAADVGRGAVDELVAMAGKGNADARQLALHAVDAPNAEVRSYAVTMIQRLFDGGSLEPWLVALGSRHTDVRLSVVDRLVDSSDPRVDEALRRALESDHEDLRLRAAEALAARGEARTVDVLAAFLRREDARVSQRALQALVALSHARTDGDSARRAGEAAALAVAARIEDDPDKNADRFALIDGLSRIGHVAGQAVLLTLLGDEQGPIRTRAFDALVTLARHPTEGPRRLPRGGTRARHDDTRVLGYLGHATQSTDPELRRRAVAVLRDVDDAGAEPLLATLLEDREPDIRVAACEALAFRAEHVPGASLEALALALREGRRELVLPAAAGLAGKRRPEAFQALLLVLKAGEQPERERAILSLGTLGDRRALEELEPLLDPDAEITDEDRALAPTAIEALGRMLPWLVSGASGANDEEEHRRVRALVERMAREGASNLRTRALTGLRHAGDPRSRSVLEAAVADRFEDASVRQHAIRELGELRDGAAEAVLADALDDDASPVRREAVTALSKLFADEPTRTNLLALRSRHSDVSAPAASFLASHGDPVTLVARMGEIDDADVRRRLRRGLVRRGECPQASVTSLLTADTTAARADAAWIAGASGQPALAPAVDRAATLSADAWVKTKRAALGKDAETRTRLSELASAWRASLWAARRLGEAAGLTAARTAVDQTEAPAHVRREALRLLADHGDPSDVARAQAALSDPDAGVRRAAAQLVSARAPDQAAALLTAQTVADAAAIAPVAQAALDRSANDLLASDAARVVVLPTALGLRKVQELGALAQTSGKGPGRLTAIGSLGRLGGDTARQTLEGILGRKDEPEEVRKAAFRSLRRLQRAQARARAHASARG